MHHLFMPGSGSECSPWAVKDKQQVKAALGVVMVIEARDGAAQCRDVSWVQHQVQRCWKVRLEVASILQVY